MAYREFFSYHIVIICCFSRDVYYIRFYMFCSRLGFSLFK